MCKFAHYSCMILRLLNYNLQSQDWNAISGFWLCATQSRDCANFQIMWNMNILLYMCNVAMVEWLTSKYLS